MITSYDRKYHIYKKKDMEKKTETQALMEALEREALRSNKPKIDWEKRRYEIAKDVMNGVLFSPTMNEVSHDLNFEDIAVFSVGFADALIKELKRNS